MALFVVVTAVFAQLQDVLNRIFRTDATHLPDIATWLRFDWMLPVMALGGGLTSSLFTAVFDERQRAHVMTQ